ncbi:MAG TPA: hypothetical protein VG820_07920 [Fimbriimonadaceae bacterium]|nr:hypothetical protein [Fimbriimonadaceae bacterium]
MKDNKKLIVVVALALVIVCVGVFQFLSSGSPAPAKSVKKDSKKASTDALADDTPKNPLFAQNLPTRDPFQAPASVTTPPQAQQQKPIQPPTDSGQRVPTLPPLQIDKQGGFGNAPLSVQPVPEAKFAFTVSGVMLGTKPMAVFTDAQGNQRLVMLGGSLDPDSTVVSIDKDAVTVRFHGKTLRLTVEGNPNAK